VTEFKIAQQASPGERYAPAAFDAQVGTGIPLNLYGAKVATATLTAADVSGDGTSVLLTLDLDDTENTRRGDLARTVLEMIRGGGLPSASFRLPGGVTLHPREAQEYTHIEDGPGPGARKDGLT
jgi:hypothetical protein